MVQELNDPEFLEELIQEADGVLVVYGFEKTWGHQGDVDGALFDNAKLYGVDRFVKVPSRRLPDLRQDEEITVDGERYVIRGHQRLDEGTEDLSTDGALTVIFLAQPEDC